MRTRRAHRHLHHDQRGQRSEDRVRHIGEQPSDPPSHPAGEPGLRDRADLGRRRRRPRDRVVHAVPELSDSTAETPCRSRRHGRALLPPAGHDERRAEGVQPGSSHGLRAPDSADRTGPLPRDDGRQPGPSRFGSWHDRRWHRRQVEPPCLGHRRIVGRAPAARPARPPLGLVDVAHRSVAPGDLVAGPRTYASRSPSGWNAGPGVRRFEWEADAAVGSSLTCTATSDRSVESGELFEAVVQVLLSRRPSPVPSSKFLSRTC